jgi:glycosyltransferase involved in cell wall biosynthesis
MPKVLRIINRFNLGGPTYNASYLTKYMAPEFETLLVGGRKDESEENSEYIVRSLGIEPVIIPEMRRSLHPYYDTVALGKIKKIIKKFKPDIVHTHASKAGALGRRAAYDLKVPVIIHTFHGHVFDAYFSGIKSAFYQRIERNLAKKSSKIIALSENQRYDLVIRYKICPNEKVEIIPLGFDLSRFQENLQEKRQTFRKLYKIDDDEIAIGIVGRIVPVKNHELFVEAISYLKKNSTKKIRAFIVGDGEDRLKTEDKARSLGIDFIDSTRLKEKATITFTSWLKDVDFVNAGMDIITLTSLNEGTPVSLIEAQASNKPIVTTSVGGIQNIVVPGKTALLSDIYSRNDYFENLLKMVEDDNLRNSFSGEGWNFVREKFHYTRLVSEMKKLYYNLKKYI